MTKLEKKKRNAKIATIVSYVISGLTALFGLTLAVISIIGDYLGSNNPIKNWESSTYPIFGAQLSWRYYGVILILLACVIFVITILLVTRKSDASEKLEEKRAARTTLKLDKTPAPTDEVVEEVK